MADENYKVAEKTSIKVWRVLFAGALIIVIAEVVIMELFTAVHMQNFNSIERSIIDALLLIFIVSPFLYYFVLLPLKRATLSEERIHSILYDSLTSFPRSDLFHEMVEHEISTARREAYCAAMIIIDPAEISGINHALGYKAGDTILSQVAQRIKLAVRETDIPSRLSGDEFGIYLPHVDVDQVKLIEKKIRKLLDDPYEIGDSFINIRTSMGISIFPDHADCAEDLIKRANLARIRAKKYKVESLIFDVQYESDSHQRLMMFGQLRKAMKNSEFELYYQPKVSVQAGDLTGVEALVRWTGEHGQPPSVFIPLAEQTGLINDITTWIFMEAMHQCSEWNRQGLRIPVSINISIRNLFDSNFCGKLIQHCEEESLSPELITIEVTESVFMEHLDATIASLQRLKDHGFKISIDDFGTGYSSLAYLKLLPVTELKIDQSFVKNILTDEKDAILVASTIKLAKDFGLQVVVEGIETEAAMEKVKACGCDIIQGYYFSRPLPAKALIEWHEQWKEPS